MISGIFSVVQIFERDMNLELVEMVESIYKIVFATIYRLYWPLWAEEDTIYTNCPL